MNKESWGFLHPSSSDTTATWTQNMTDGHQRIMLRLDTISRKAQRMRHRLGLSIFPFGPLSFPGAFPAGFLPSYS